LNSRSYTRDDRVRGRVGVADRGLLDLRRLMNHLIIDERVASKLERCATVPRILGNSCTSLRAVRAPLAFIRTQLYSCWAIIVREANGQRT